MNLRQLEYFTACAEELNFTRAAERCYITQTAMTQQIRALETSLGAQLFIRDKHHVELTRAGTVFYGEAKAILRRSEAAVKLVQNADEAEEGHIAVGFIRGYGHSDLARVLYLYRSAHPAVSVTLVRDNENGLISRLKDGTLDVIFSVTPYTADLPGLEHRLLKKYPLVVVLNTNHPMAGKPYLTYRDLKQEPFVLMQPASRQRSETEEARFILERGGFLPEVAAMEAEPETLLLQVAIGTGISIVPEYVVHNSYTREDIRIVPLVKEDHAAETLDFEMLWPTERANKALQPLIELVY